MIQELEFRERHIEYLVAQFRKRQETLESLATRLDRAREKGDWALVGHVSDELGNLSVSLEEVI